MKVDSTLTIVLVYIWDDESLDDFFRPTLIEYLSMYWSLANRCY